MDLLGRYYTQNLFSDLLVSNITFNEPGTILELGAGDGALLKAAVNRWLNASFIATDIDADSVASIANTLPFVNIFRINSLASSLSRQLKIQVGSVDVAVCNPPYLRLKSLKPYAGLFEMAQLPLCKKMNFVTSDIVFLAQNLSLLKKEGQLGIILPDSLITGHEFHGLRQSLLENHKISKIIQLPENIFPKTEALTHILFIEKGVSTNSAVEIFEADIKGMCKKHLTVESSRLMERMDYKYHSHFKEPTLARPAENRHLSEFSPEIRRGNIEQKQLRGRNISQVHTTTLKHACKKLVFKKKLGKIPSKKYITADPGDILLARVGRGCIGKVSMVRKGNAVISDCIYRIRVAKEHREMIFDAFVSEEGQKWFKAMSHGVCAKVVSKFDLLKFPIFAK